MIKAGELAKTAKEHLTLEEVQLAIGEFSVAATGFGTLAAEFVTGRMDFKSWMASGLIGQAAYKAGETHWQKAREILGYREPDSETDSDYY
jgi:hypothetical protein